MNKEIVICIIVVISVIIISSFLEKYTKSTVEYMDEILENMKELLEKEDENKKENVEYKMKEIIDIWKEKYEKLAFFIEHDELEKVETELTSMQACIEVEEYKEAVPSLEKSVFILNHIKEKFKLNMKNIF